MTRNRTICVATITAALAALPAHAQQATDTRIRELVRQASERIAAGQAGNPAPQTTTSQAPGATRPTVRLTLDDVVKAALDHNLNIAVQRLNPEIQDISVASLESVYRPTLTSQLSTASTSTPSNTALAGGSAAGSAVDSGLTTFNGGIAQSVPWGGGSLAVNLNNNKATSTSLNNLYNPTYNTNWAFQYTQPLMRGRVTDATRQSIIVTKLSRDISDVQLRATITNTLSNVRNAYWNYVFAVQSVEVAKQSVTLAARLVQDNQTRVQVGTMAPLDVVQAQSQAATAQQNLVTAQSTMRTNELTLKQLIVGGTEDPIWNATIDPVDRPDFRPEPIDIEGAVRRALSERTDLAIAKKNLAVNDVTVGYLRNQLLPQADFVANYGLVGIGGDVLAKSGTGVNQVATGVLTPGGYSDALSSLLRSAYPRWTLSLNLSYPIGLSSAQAVVARARVQQSQDQAQVKVIELQVATDVTNAAVSAQSAVERVQAAQAARELAQRQLDAENSKFEVGMSTNYLVVQSQRDLATAQNNELQAILNYRIALVELDRLQQTTLGVLGITLVSNATR
jgi:outer membrane protein TolC